MAEFQAEEAAMPYNPNAQPSSQIEQVLQQNQSALLAKPGVTGIGVGKSEIGDPAIVVYLLDRGYGAAIPKEVNGIPVILQVTGRIEAQPR